MQTRKKPDAPVLAPMLEAVESDDDTRKIANKED